MNSALARAGWQATLDLSFERRAAGTVLCRNSHQGPLQVQKVLYPEGRDTCHAAILHPPGGIAAGDSLSIAASLGENARALLTTPGATKWYRSEGDSSSQEIRWSLSGDALLEWLPRENILFDGSDLSMGLTVALAPTARYFGWEILSFGRRASGESWRRGKLVMRTTIRRANRLLWSEVANLAAAGEFAGSAVGLSGSTVCGTFVVTDEVSSELLGICREIKPAEAARVGVTCLPGVLIARYLGGSTEDAFNWFTALWTLLRPALTARAACAPRVWAC
jgi:urease accessory protein